MPVTRKHGEAHGEAPCPGPRLVNETVAKVVGLLCPARLQRELTRGRAERVWGALLRRDEEAIAADVPLAGVGLAFKKQGADIHVTGLSSDGSAARSTN